VVGKGEEWRRGEVRRGKRGSGGKRSVVKFKKSLKIDSGFGPPYAGT